HLPLCRPRGRTGVDEMKTNSGVEIGICRASRIEDVARQLAVRRARLDEIETPVALEALPHFLELSREHGAERGPDVDAGEEIAVAAGAPRGARIVAVLGMIERDRHELGHREWTAFPDSLDEEVADGGGHGLGLKAQGSGPASRALGRTFATVD